MQRFVGCSYVHILWDPCETKNSDHFRVIFFCLVWSGSSQLYCDDVIVMLSLGSSEVAKPVVI